MYPRPLCEAICSGVTQQKAFDASANVGTSPLTRGQLCSFVVKLAGRRGIDEFHRPAGGWPEHWIDEFRESEGGLDMFGHRLQDGQDIYKKEA